MGTSLAPTINCAGALTTDFYEAIVLGECYTCNEQGQQLEAPPMDLRNLGSIHQKDRKLQDNLCRLPLLCPCSSSSGTQRRTVGIQAIILKSKRPGTFELQCRAQCFACQLKSQELPALDTNQVGQYQQLLTVQCCDKPQVKVQTLKMHFTPTPAQANDQILPKVFNHLMVLEEIPLPPPASLQKTCGVCCEPITGTLVSCSECPIAYHAHCQKQWLARNRRLMAPKCLYCFSPLGDEHLADMVNVEDVYIHANSLSKESLEGLTDLLPGAQDCIIRRPKQDPKKSAPALRPSTLYLAWYRFASERVRDAAYDHAVRNGLRVRLGLRTLNKGENKLRSNRKFGEVFDSPGTPLRQLR